MPNGTTWNRTVVMWRTVIESVPALNLTTNVTANLTCPLRPANCSAPLVFVNATSNATVPFAFAAPCLVNATCVAARQLCARLIAFCPTPRLQSYIAPLQASCSSSYPHSS
jgi:hypothetical protein